MRGRARWAVLLAAAMLQPAWAGSAHAANGPNLKHPGVRVLLSVDSAAAASGSSDVMYHVGGPVIDGMTVHAIYWEPGRRTTPAKYKTVINGFLGNIAAASGTNGNVYGLTAQYADSSGNVAAYQETFAGQTMDTTPYPANGCTPPRHGEPCLTDAQLQAELANVTAGLPHDLHTLYAMFLPSSVQVCKPGNNCTFNGAFCAYHFVTGTQSAPLLYAIVPYPTAGCFNQKQAPNGSIADSTVSLLSHEMNEAITDPLLNAWYTGNDEVGDLCRFTYGPALGGKPGSEYNQIINGGHYFIQDEWSNRGFACLAKPPAGGLSPPTASFSTSPSAPTVGQPVTFDGTGSLDPAGTISSYQWTFGDGISAGTGSTATHVYLSSGTESVSLEVIDTDNLVGFASGQVTVAAAQPSAPPKPDIAVGGFSACALLSGGSVDCWGNNDSGQLGDGTVTASATPAPVTGLSGATQIAAGLEHACALLTAGTVACWGNDDNGQLGSGVVTNNPYPTPVAVTAITAATQIAAGQEHTCALLSGGTVDCWGANSYGQLAESSALYSAIPVQIEGLSGVTQIVAGGYDTCALLSDGTVDCWGDNANGRLGNGTTANTTSPTPVSGITTATQITAGGDHTCALLADGTADCWGYNAYGEVGDGTTTDTSTPVPVTGLTGAIGITAGSFHTCALLSDGTASCWGDNAAGELGNGTTINSPVPVAVSGLLGAAQIAAGGGETCTVLTGGTVNCWGYNVSGELGDGTTTNSSIPVAVAGISNAG